MIRFSFVQARTQMLIAVAGLALVAAMLAVTGPHLFHLYHTTVLPCSKFGDCPSAIRNFVLTDTALQNWVGILVMVVPGLIGVFWGAPLVAREIETGTYRLAWTQSVTRSRWLAAKVGVVGLASVAVSGMLSLALTWWSGPIDKVQMDRFANFDQRGLVSIGYAAFAFVLGVTAGVLIRRTLPAMATTLVAFVAARVSFTDLVRARLLAARHQSLALNPFQMSYISANGGPAVLQPPTPTIPNAWVYSSQIVDRAGHQLTAQILSATCPGLGQRLNPPPPGAGAASGPVAAPPGVAQALHDCVAKVGVTYHQLVVYQPASHFWPLQWYETAIYVAAALALAGACFWLVRRRLS